MRREEFPEKGFDDKLHYGLVAQELEKIFPEFVGENSEGYKMVAYSGLIPVLVKGFQEQQAKIENLKQENNELKRRLASIEEKLEKLIE